MSERCKKDGCESEAGFIPFIVIPLTCCSNCEPITLRMDLPLCETHVGEVQVLEVLDPKVKAQIDFHVEHGRNRTPDYKKAYVEKVAMTDPRYIEFKNGITPDMEKKAS